ncbi:MAG: succinylglutamate desuccinylase/aspartoacylase family protein [Gammaproteobacteria bacterium]
MPVRKSRNRAFTLGGIRIEPGENRYIELPLPALYTHSNVFMPVHVTVGRVSGPTMFISAAIHGDEINGVEIIRRVINSKSIRRLKGTLVLVPVVNVFGFINKSRYLPDRRDLNRAFPGSEQGSMAAKLAHLFLQEISRKCDYGIDLHTAAIGRENLPQIRARILNDPHLGELASAFGAPVILNADFREGSLRQSAAREKCNILLYEAGEALRFDEIAIRAGVKGIINVMRQIGMLPASRRRKQRIEPAVAHSSRWVRAPKSGILRTTCPMGKRIHKDEILGYVSDPFGASEIAVRSPVNGMIIGKTTLPLVHEGEAIFHIARFEALSDAEAVLETFQNEIDPVENGPRNPEDEPMIF